MNIDVSINSREFFWKELSPVTVGDYLSELRNLRKSIKTDDAWWIIRFTQTDKFIEQVQKSIDDEIKLCQFYFELHKKKKSKNFNKWRELTKSEVESLNWYPAIDRTVHFIDNGKISCYVIISKPSVMTLIELKVKNSSGLLEFTDEKVVENIYRSSDEKITEGICRLKNSAEEYMNNNSWPKYDRRAKVDFDIYSTLIGNK